MNVLVTGHLGYIGTVLTPLFCRAGHDVVGLDSDIYSRWNISLWRWPAITRRSAALLKWPIAAISLWMNCVMSSPIFSWT